MDCNLPFNLSYLLHVVGKSSYSGPEVYELEVNLQDGIILARLMEILAGVKAKGINKTPKIKAHKIDNLTQVLKIMDGQKIRLVSISKFASFTCTFSFIRDFRYARHNLNSYLLLIRISHYIKTFTVMFF